MSVSRSQNGRERRTQPRRLRTVLADLGRRGGFGVQAARACADIHWQVIEK
jgi:hypothetical protein